MNAPKQRTESMSRTSEQSLWSESVHRINGATHCIESRSRINASNQCIGSVNRIKESNQCIAPVNRINGSNSWIELVQQREAQNLGSFICRCGGQTCASSDNCCFAVLAPGTSASSPPASVGSRELAMDRLEELLLQRKILDRSLKLPGPQK